MVDRTGHIDWIDWSVQTEEYYDKVDWIDETGVNHEQVYCHSKHWVCVDVVGQNVGKTDMRMSVVSVVSPPLFAKNG